MNLNFDIPTPKSCGGCKFGYTDKNDKDHSWVIRCLINGDLESTFQDGRAHRHPDCPGTVNEDEEFV